MRLEMLKIPSQIDEDSPTRNTSQYFATLLLEMIVDLLVDGRHGKPVLGSTAYQEPRLRVGVQSVWDEDPGRWRSGYHDKWVNG
jgi:hypothetical protein